MSVRFSRFQSLENMLLSLPDLHCKQGCHSALLAWTEQYKDMVKLDRPSVIRGTIRGDRLNLSWSQPVHLDGLTGMETIIIIIYKSLPRYGWSNKPPPLARKMPSRLF